MPFGFPFSLCGLIFVDLDSLWAQMPGGKQKFKQKASQAMALSWHQLGLVRWEGGEAVGYSSKFNNLAEIVHCPTM